MITNFFMNLAISYFYFNTVPSSESPAVPGTADAKRRATSPTEHTKKPAEGAITLNETTQRLIAEKGRVSKVRSSLINNSILLSMDNPNMTFQAKSESGFLRRRLMNSLKLGGGGAGGACAKSKALQGRRKVKLSFKAGAGGCQDHPDKIGFGGKAANGAMSNSSSFNDDEELVMDPVDPNLVYSVNGLTRHYVLGEKFSVTDPSEGFLDLHCVKHIRQGCVDENLLTSLGHIAGKYAISEFDQMNVISIVYGSTFAENRLVRLLFSVLF